MPFLIENWFSRLAIIALAVSISSIDSFLIVQAHSTIRIISNLSKLTAEDTKNAHSHRNVKQDEIEVPIVNNIDYRRCLAIPGTTEESLVPYVNNFAQFNSIEEFISFILPIVVPIVAFNTFKITNDAFGYLFSSFAEFSSLEDVDLNIDSVASVATNGIALTAIALTFATLTSLTVGSLRERLRELRIYLNSEACLIQDLLLYFDSLSMPNEAHISCLKDLEKYTNRLISESQPKSAYSSQISLLNSELREIRMRVDVFNNENYSIATENLTPQVHAAISELKEYRSNRIGVLQSNYPPTHYITLGLLATSICLVFFVDVYTNHVSEDDTILKIYWAITLGTFTILTTSCYDLHNAFQGSYSAVRNTHSFYLLRDYMREKIKEIKKT